MYITFIFCKNLNVKILIHTNIMNGNSNDLGPVVWMFIVKFNPE